MARKKVSILTLLGVGVGLVNGASRATDNWTNVNAEYVLNGVSEAFFGYDFVNNQFHAEDLVLGWGPTVIGILGHYVASRVGINKYFAFDGVEL
ncbi:MAG: hypothetical protein QW429_04030 [Thermoprotei archaeon]